ncbi:hypothetical protein DL96DRAFT_1702808 [Flagelloscypha sp. PMI_526]|nr:hypothetical protein DL96DRAFT_1702808 [Flagelloscypha sp. PMI_526]
MFPTTIWLLLSPLLCLAENVDYIPQSFFFDYNKDSEVVPVPVTTQCETIHVKWSRSVATGPDPVAPYYLQVYTSNFVFPFVIPAGSGSSFDWQVPFAPGTLYQTCMVDKNGNSGGCQDTYTVIAATSTPSCSNASFPLGPLQVEAISKTGPISQFGWIDQCSDIAITPKNGTPPYTITISPTLHPVYNITLKGQETFNWTVALSWASPFFISVSDSASNFWSNGPLHSGGGPGTSTKCLNTDGQESVSIGAIVGTGVGGLVVGALIGIGSVIFFFRYKTNRRRGKFEALDMSSAVVVPYDTSLGMSNSTSEWKPTPSVSSSQPFFDSPPPSGGSRLKGSGSGSDYIVEPFSLPGGSRDSYMPVSPQHEMQPSQSSSSGRGQGMEQRLLNSPHNTVEVKAGPSTTPQPQPGSQSGMHRNSSATAPLSPGFQHAQRRPQQLGQKRGSPSAPS